MVTYKQSATELIQMAVKRLNAGDKDGAVSHFELSLTCEKRLSTYAHLAELCIELDEIERAKEYLDRSLEMSTDSADKDSIERLNRISAPITQKYNDMKAEESTINKLKSANDLTGLIEHFGLSKYTDSIHASLTDSYRLVLSSDSADSSRSKIGGRPLLPDKNAWPRSKDRVPLSFLCQLDLLELSKTYSVHQLPSSGILSFFYETENFDWGRDPNGKSSWSVNYFPDNTDVHVVDFPADLEDCCRFPPNKVSFQKELCLVDFNDIRAECLPFTSHLNYTKLVQALCGNGARHRLLGFPQILQGDIGAECELASSGFKDWPRTESESWHQVMQGARNWRLLLQIDTDEENANMCWGDVGTLYYCIREDDLRKRAFSNCWFVGQCC